MSTPSFMVSIGHFGQPSVIELQAKVIRATCGENTPILVSDDYTETAGDPERGKRLKDRLLDICYKYNLIFRHTGESRIGHAGGDLGSFYHGLVHAREYKIDWVCKLSQRFVIDIPNWLPKFCRLMKKGELQFNTGCAGCLYGRRVVFHMRTECVLMETAAWSVDSVLKQLLPRPLPTSTEHIIADICADINGGKRRMLSPSWLPNDRHQSVDDVLWKDNLPTETTDQKYRDKFSKYGVIPGEEFNVLPSCMQPGHLSGIVYAR